MRMKRRFVAAVSAVVVASAVVRANASAVDLAPSERALAAAAAAGGAMATRNEAYEIGPYLLFGTTTDVLLTDDSPAIEAVQLATPLERIRWFGYVAKSEQRPLQTRDLDAADTVERGKIAFIIFAHGHDEHDRTFLDRFGSGTLTRADGSVVASADIERSKATQDQYFMAGNRVVNRYLGQITYHFTLPVPMSAADASAPLTFTFTDDTGKLQHYSIVLAHYQ